MSEPITVSKLDAARRQLRLAIRLMFDNADPVPVHTLAGAASVLLSDLVEVRMPHKSWDRFIQNEVGVSTRYYFRVMREAQNFLKHAKEEPDATYQFHPADTECLLFWAIMNLGELEGECPTPEYIYWLWFLASFDEDIHDDQSPWSDALALFGDMRNWSREDRLQAGKRELDKWLTE